MEKYTYKKRNKLDIILTDASPMELPCVFSLKHFYDFLNENKYFKKWGKDVQRDGITYFVGNKAQNTVINSSWHATPLKFHVSKNNDKLRELSVLNPLSLMEIYLFLNMYEKLLLDYSSGDSYSIRKRKANDNFKFRGIENKLVKYNQKEKELLALEKTGNYFAIGPYKKITDFYKSDEWFRLNSLYSYYGKLDYSQCFHTIYTHTFSWIVTRNSVDGKKYSKNQFFLNDCDTLMQNINASVTNGIVVGPEFSRMMADIIMQYIDQQVKDKLRSEGYTEDVDYHISRFIDDIFIFTNYQELVDTIIRLFAEEAERFHLRINSDKLEVGNLPKVWFPWKQEIVSVKQYIIDTVFNGKDSHQVEINRKMLSNMKQFHQNLIAKFWPDRTQITSYVLKIFYNKFKDGKKNIFNYKNVEQDCQELVDILFSFFSYAPSYYNTKVLLSVLNYIKAQVSESVFRESIEMAIWKHQAIILKANLEDVLDFIIFLAAYNIELPRLVESKVEERVTNKDNPLLYAVWLMYAGYDKTYEIKIAERIEKCIVDALARMHDSKNFFMYSEVWWIYIFMDCPQISSSCREKMKKKLNTVTNGRTATAEIEFLNGKIVDYSATCKYLVAKFMLEKGSKFIEWKFDADIILERIEFATSDRTIFNGQLFLEKEYDGDWYY